MLTSNELKNIFGKQAESNTEKPEESIHGWRSFKAWTVNVRSSLKFIIKNMNIQTVFDAGCGDFNWMETVDLSHVKYIGADIVDKLIENNKKKALEKAINAEFKIFDITSEIPTSSDLIICRFTMNNYDFDSIVRIIDNFKDSGSKYLLMTTTQGEDAKYTFQNTKIGDYRVIDFLKPPFGLYPAEFFIHEGYYGHMMGLWDFSKIRHFNSSRVKQIAPMNPKYNSFDEFRASNDYKQIIDVYDQLKQISSSKEEKK